MPIYARRKEYENPPAGLHAAVCVDVVDLGLLETPWGKKVQIKVVWQLAEKNKKGYRFLVSKRYTPSLYKKGNKKSNLRADLESWRGKEFTPEEEKKFDIESVLGANCQLSLVLNMTDNGVFTNVASVVPPAKMQEKLYAQDYEREIHREGYVAPVQPDPEDESEAYSDEVPDDDRAPF